MYGYEKCKEWMVTMVRDIVRDSKAYFIKNKSICLLYAIGLIVGGLFLLVMPGEPEVRKPTPINDQIKRMEKGLGSATPAPTITHSPVPTPVPDPVGRTLVARIAPDIAFRLPEGQAWIPDFMNRGIKNLRCIMNDDTRTLHILFDYDPKWWPISPGWLPDVFFLEIYNKLGERITMISIDPTRSPPPGYPAPGWMDRPRYGTCPLGRGVHKTCWIREDIVGVHTVEIGFGLGDTLDLGKERRARAERAAGRRR